MASYTSEIVLGSAVAVLGVAAYYIVSVGTKHAALEARIRQLEKEGGEGSATPGQQAASDLHVKAWGKPWPQSKDTISRNEIYAESDSVDNDEVDIALADKLRVPTHFEYRYFEEIRSLKSALGTSPGRDKEDDLVVREEYEVLRQALENNGEDERAIVVTGHPGIGSYQT